MLSNYSPSIPQHDEYIAHSVDDGILNFQGKAFTVIKDFRTQQTSYLRVKGGFFHKSDRWKKKRNGDYTYPTDIKTYCKSIPKECSSRLESVILSDDRASSACNDATVITGLRLIINVPEHYATEIYKARYGNIGIPFKERLLTHHRPLMERLTTYDNRRYLTHHTEESLKADMARIYTTESTIFVCVNGISRYSPNDPEFVDYGRTDLGIMFSDYGMSDLDGVSQCYGMALTLIEILKPKWENHGTVSTKLIHHTSAGSPYIEIRYRLEQANAKPLTKW